MLGPLLAEFELILVEVDIIESEELLARYGLRIPVIRLEGAAADLGWPFDARQAVVYLQGNGL